MSRRSVIIVLMGALCASAALAVTYEWIGEGEDTCWTTQDNWDWDHSVNPHYPNTTVDTAIIGSDGPWSVGLVSEEIMVLQVDGDTTFSACQGESSPILTAGYAVFYGSASEGYTTVTVSSGRIEAHD
jgi:hypothetical protein